ncbi:MAG TPA: peptide ABC transporter substrate-binding protein [Candidatus Dormibacteraeota bacterium]|nr:peptide ABC transporter substrate-binding protein [Candidatus Dormibacteraeota bacterium]
MRRPHRSGGLLALAALFLMTGCNVNLPVPIARTGPVPGGQVVEAISGSPGPLNPLFEQEDNARDIDTLIYQGLTTVDRSQKVVGLLASSWTIGDGGLSYTFNLRPRVRWADGKPFTADDVMFTYSILQSPDYQEPTRQYWKQLKVEQVGDMQIKFTLKAQSAGFPLAMRQGIIPRHLFQGVPIADMAASPYSGARAVGTGPFKVRSISSDHHIVTLDRNPYARPRPYLDSFVFRSYPLLDDAVDAVSRGEADMAGELALPSASTLAKRQDLSLMQIRTFNVATVLFNLGPDLQVYFNPASVRQALSQAIDRKKIVRDVLQGRADPAPGPIPPSNWAFSKQAADKLSYDQAEAAKALQAAGWTMNVQTGILSRAGRDFSVTLVTTDAYPFRQVAEEVSAQLRLIGVQVKLAPSVPASVLVSKYLIGRQYQMALTVLDNGSDPDQYSFWHSGASPDTINFAVDRLPKQALIDKDLEDGRAISDVSQRRLKYDDFQQLMSEAAPAMFLFEPYYTYVVSKRLKGLHTNPVIEPGDRLQYVADWYVTTRIG